MLLCLEGVRSGSSLNQKSADEGSLDTASVHCIKSEIVVALMVRRISKVLVLEAYSFESGEGNDHLSTFGVMQPDFLSQ